MLLFVHVMQYIYHEWRGFLALASDLRDIFVRSSRKQKSTSLKMVHSKLIFTNIVDILGQRCALVNNCLHIEAICHYRLQLVFDMDREIY